MKQLLAKLEAYWSTMEDNDRSALKLGSAMAFILLVGGLVILPAVESYEGLQDRLPKMRTQLETLRAQSLEVKRLRSNPSAQRSGESTLSLLESSTNLHGIKSQVESLTPQSNHVAAIRFKNVEYSRLIKWMAGLRSQYHLQVSEAEFSRTSIPGTVDAYLLFPDPER
ncbi:MAG: type II secretion system protein M [Acidiferrobacterales bacterium]|jgi:type II secretory pathway component PulM|nr:type II secretion system protein M [Acidiferrobacterales bacterium]